MTERIFLKPAPLEIEGSLVPRKVRKPVGTYLAEAGEAVNLDTYWRRKLDAGEVEQAVPPAEPEAEPEVPAETAAALAPGKKTKPAE